MCLRGATICRSVIQKWGLLFVGVFLKITLCCQRIEFNIFLKCSVFYFSVRNVIVIYRSKFVRIALDVDGICLLWIFRVM